MTTGISWRASWESPWGWGGIYGGKKAEVEPPFLLGCPSEISPLPLEVAEFNTTFPATTGCLWNPGVNAKPFHEKQSFIFIGLLKEIKTL